MANSPFLVTVSGNRNNPDIKEINVRGGPGTGYESLFKAPVGQANLPVLEVRTDDKGIGFQNKVYQWLRVSFPNGREGWMRDDLVDVIGDGSRFGYVVVLNLIPAFSIVRDTSVGVLRSGQQITPVGQVGSPSFSAPVTTPPPPAPVTAPAPAVPVAPAPAAPAVPAAPAAPAPTPTVPLERVRAAAFNITSAFEGGGYGTYQTYDSGIISYGRFQFTLSAGSFITVLNRFFERSQNPVGPRIQAYMPRITAKDEGLRKDPELKALCVEAAKDPIMQAIQNEVATEGFWQPVIDLSIKPRNIQTPLGYALLFDMSIQHGRFNFLVPKAEEVLRVPPKSVLGSNGTTEQIFIAKVAQLRQENLYALADKLKLPGMRKRGDFWVNLVNSGDWNLQGDAAGNLNINGKIVQVRNP